MSEKELIEFIYNVTIEHDDGTETRELSAEVFEEEDSKQWIEEFVECSYTNGKIVKMELIGQRPSW
jgi:hypothetical protein